MSSRRNCRPSHRPLHQAATAGQDPECWIFFPHTFRRCLGMWVPIFMKEKDSGEAWERTDCPMDVTETPKPPGGFGDY